MKRIHLFEFEDLPWFPHWIRKHMTNMLNAVHRLMGTAETIASLLDPFLKDTQQTQILDLCSGSGGPIIDATHLLRSNYGIDHLSLTLSDLYPNEQVAQQINASKDGIRYLITPVDATQQQPTQEGLRTMICSFHHLRPVHALNILQSVQQGNQPFFLFELSDNSQPPTFLWWLALPFNFLFALFVSIKTRPFTWQQFVFSFILPILPLFFAWDGAVSNTRTYTREDLEELLAQLPTSNYKWQIGTIKGVPGNHLYLKGMPVAEGING